MSRRFVIMSLSIACCWGLSSVPAGAGGLCHEAPRPFDARTQVVPIKDYCFTPVVVRIRPKQSITWINRDMDTHNVTGVGGTWGSLEEQLSHRERVSYSFAEEGVYPYFCFMHPGMSGAVVVGDGVPSGGVGTVSSATAEAAPRKDRPASEARSLAWLWGAPVVLAAGVVIGLRRKLT